MKTGYILLTRTIERSPAQVRPAIRAATSPQQSGFSRSSRRASRAAASSVAPRLNSATRTESVPKSMPMSQRIKPSSPILCPYYSIEPARRLEQ